MANPDKKRVVAKQWYLDNHEKARMSRAQWKRDHMDRIVQYTAKWRRTYPDKVVAQKQRRRGYEKGNGGAFTDIEWATLKEHYHFRCLCCGKSGVRLTPDHVLPLSMGGTSDISNIQPLCRSCNSRKNARYIDYRVEV